jgi:hypothetical protein
VGAVGVVPQDDVANTQRQHVAGGGGDGDDTDVQQALEALFLTGETALERARQDADAQVRLYDNRYIWQDWLKNTRWARRLAGFDRHWLLQQMEWSAESKEGNLFRVCWAPEAIIRKAQRAASSDVVGLRVAIYIEPCVRQ